MIVNDLFSCQMCLRYWNKRSCGASYLQKRAGAVSEQPYDVCFQQPPLNAQMLAQRQREIYSIQHRQRQLFQQKVMLMRQNMAGAPAGSVGSIGTARASKVAPTTPQPPQQPPQQPFSFPQAYNPLTGKPPTSPSPFSPMAGGPLDNKVTVRVPLNNQTLLGGVQGQFSSVNSSIQQGLFQQFSGSGEFRLILLT